MSRDQGPTDCCTYACTQGRNCPVRIARLTTAEGGNQVDTDSTFTQADALVILGMFSASAIVVVFLIMSAFYYFWG